VITVPRLKPLVAGYVALLVAAGLGGVAASPASAANARPSAGGAEVALLPTKTLALNSQTVFCSFLPPRPGESIGESEATAIAFCTRLTPDAPGAKRFPAGFIRSAHFVQTPDYVQVTGTINRAAYKLSKSDGGGQYDPSAPPGAGVTRYLFFVNLIEPDVNRFCIRASNNAAFITLNRSQDGCEVVVPGDYS
jgi:hypothetical protein